MPVPLISLALRRSRPLVRRQMAEMVPSDLLMKRGSSPAPRGLLTASSRPARWKLLLRCSAERCAAAPPAAAEREQR